MVFILGRVQIGVGVGKNIFMICMSEKILMKYLDSCPSSKFYLGYQSPKTPTKNSVEENTKTPFISCNTLYIFETPHIGND